MQYRKFGSCDFKMSALGFGCMRLPIIDGDMGKIDEPEAIRMIRYGIDQGINYIDTAYPYHQGNSETLVGKALKDGYREKVKLATKLPMWKIETTEDCDRYLNEQLEKLDTDHIDFYLLHTLNKDYWKKVKDLEILKFLDRAIADGRIKYAGFSYHNPGPELFKEIVDSYDWTFAQIQLNYLDENFQAGMEGLKYAHAKGLAVVVMEPIKGGHLAKDNLVEVQAIWDQSAIKRTPAEWALRWVWNLEEVAVVLSGMSEMAHVEENIRVSQDALPNTLTKKDLELIEQVKEIYHSKMKVDCTGCYYCMSCPEDIYIAPIFEYYNNVYMYNSLEDSQKVYQRFIEQKKDASKCVACGACEQACPQGLSIIQYLKDAHRVLTD